MKLHMDSYTYIHQFIPKFAILSTFYNLKDLLLVSSIEEEKNDETHNVPNSIF